jgi:purine-cytosine permease-like protein
MAEQLPEYVRTSTPVPASERAPWYRNTFPSYAGIYLWFAFYLSLAGPTISRAGLGICIAALVAAGLIAFASFYYTPAMLGLTTGRTLYIVGTSAFGTTGGYVMPGLLMGALQIGWFSVATYYSADFILKGLNRTSHGLFVVLVLVWAYGFAWLSIKGIRYVAMVANVLNWAPLVMIVIVFWANRGGVAQYHPEKHAPWDGFLMMLTLAIGYSATAGAAGADFAVHSRHRRDVVLGGLTGISLSMLVAGALPILSVAGHIGITGVRDYSYVGAIRAAGSLAPVMFFLFAAASAVPTCFGVFIAANSFGTILPRVPRNLSTFIGVTVGALLALSGVVENLIGFFVLVGASFGPICGAMAAEYLLSGRRWAGPRRGINAAGYAAWACGFLVGILDRIPHVPAILLRFDRPAPLLSFLVGLAVYTLLAKAGARPAAVPLEELPANNS